jgi:hypothetical protein
MLEEDYAEERFFADVRHIYWQAPANAPEHKAAEILIRTLEF